MAAQEWVVGSASGLVELSLRANERFGYQPYFRGQAVESWPLVPKLYRASNSMVSGQRVKDTERSLVNDFVRLAQTRHAACPGYQNFPAWLCLMQHYGMPTRLLDWTMSPFVAMYFAVLDEAYDSIDACIWAVNSAGLNGNQLGEFSNMSMLGGAAYPLVQAPFTDVHDLDKAAFVIPPHVDKRLIAQQSAFSIHGTALPLEQISGSDNFLFKVRVPASSKPLIRYELLLTGFSQMNLFPDLQNLAEELTRRPYASLAPCPPASRQDKGN